MSYTMAILCNLRDGYMHRGIEIFPKVDFMSRLFKDVDFRHIPIVSCKSIEHEQRDCLPRVIKGEYAIPNMSFKMHQLK